MASMTTRRAILLAGACAWRAAGQQREHGAAGLFTSPTYGSRGRYEERWQLPGRWMRTVRVPGYGVIVRGIDGSRAWEETPEFGVEAVSGARLEELRREAAIADPQRWKELAPEWEKLVLDSSGLLVRRESRETARDGSSRRVSMDYEDYRPVNGVPFAHTLRYVGPDLIWIVRRQWIG